MGQATRRKVQFMAKSQLFTAARCSSSTRTAACSRCAAARRDEDAFIIVARDPRPRRHGLRCTARAGARAPASSPSSAKPGIGRLALETGAPVVPVGDRTAPQHVRNWKRLQFPQVTVRYGEPMRWERVEHPTREQQQAVADEIFAEIKRLHASLEAPR